MQQGAVVTILLLGEGPTSRVADEAGAARNEAHSSAVRAASVLGITDVRFAEMPDNKFDSVPMLNIVQCIEAVAIDIKPDMVFTHHVGDLNIDHQITSRAVMTAFRPLPETARTCLLGFEVLSSTEYTPPHSAPHFAPNVYIGICDFLEVKQKALRAYASEMRPWPHPRSYEAVEHLARLRGCQCGLHAAEAFVLLRSVL